MGIDYEGPIMLSHVAYVTRGLVLPQWGFQTCCHYGSTELNQLMLSSPCGWIVIISFPLANLPGQLTILKPGNLKSPSEKQVALVTFKKLTKTATTVMNDTSKTCFIQLTDKTIYGE